MRILITGATGFLGRKLVGILLREGHEIIAASSNREKAERVFSGTSVRVVSNDSLFGENNMYFADCVVHAAFCRASQGGHLVESLDFSRRIFQTAMENRFSVLNISSQAVYGGMQTEIGDESGVQEPGYLYALAKSASEQLLEEASYFSGGNVPACNVRLASLIGVTDEAPNNILYKFVEHALNGEDIRIVGGTQRFSFLDVRDAAAAIALLLNRESGLWEKAYNLGPVNQTEIVGMAETVREIVCGYTGNRIRIHVQPDAGHLLNAGMISTRIYHDLNWMPGYTLEMTVEDTMKYIIKRKGGN